MGLALAACIGWAGWSTQAAGADAPVPEPIARLLGSVVGIYAEVPPTARSAQNLGTTRGGSGIVIGDDGLVLTVGYLTTDAHTINVLAPGVGPVPGNLVGYDHETGFGLVRARQPLKTPAVRFGDSDLLRKGSPVLVASIGAQPLTAAYVMDRRAYAGSWEYLLENAIYTAPVHPNFGGAALVGPEGQLLGVGSLMVNVSDGFHPPLPGNIFIPINLLKPILGDLVRDGRA
ncbi:MAG: S1C family serine protease, partial [Proteobacteria bacterium]|nr:S1C family serine protease [Pseudomonadota bacterium]